jgi:hypothetical protein
MKQLGFLHWLSWCWSEAPLSSPSLHGREIKCWRRPFLSIKTSGIVNDPLQMGIKVASHLEDWEEEK